jgi:dipeptidyl-peptidase-4
MPHWLADGSGFLWTTERRGGWQLELRGADGSLQETLTDPRFEYRGFEALDESTGSVYVTAGKDAVTNHLYRVPLNPRDGEPERLTVGAGTHGATFGKGASVYVHTQTTLTDDTAYRVRRIDGTVIGEIKSNAEQPPFEVNVELTEVGASPRMAAAIVRPRNFARGRKYPVIVHVYGGPHSQMVGVARNRYLLDQWMADHGFIVVMLDGRGTPNKGRRWERVIKGDLSKIPLEDQVSGLQMLGAKYGELDLNRVGIFGWSFGGYFSAMGVMRRPDVYHVGVAGAPVADWADYDTHYTERYMGLPQENPEGYEAANVLTYAKDLTVPLMIIHGTADDNVYLVHSLKMADALLRAGREFTFLPLAGFTHSPREPEVVDRMYGSIMNYFGRHLMPQ